MKQIEDKLLVSVKENEVLKQQNNELKQLNDEFKRQIDGPKQQNDESKRQIDGLKRQNEELKTSQVVACPICLESKKKWKIIGCGHVMCAGCVRQLKDHKAFWDHPCPTCRKSIQHCGDCYLEIE
jgi:hypothetical protein